jgi:hypothetical protein
MHPNKTEDFHHERPSPQAEQEPNERLRGRRSSESLSVHCLLSRRLKFKLGVVVVLEDSRHGGFVWDVGLLWMEGSSPETRVSQPRAT